MYVKSVLASLCLLTGANPQLRHLGTGSTAAVSWYMPAGTGEQTLAWLASAAQLAAPAGSATQADASTIATGVYLCCNQFSIDAGGGLSQPSIAALHTQSSALLQAGLTVHYVMGISNESIASGSWRDGLAIASLANTALVSGINGYIVDYEPANNYTEAHARAYADFLTALATAMHQVRGASVGFDSAGWGILDYWGVYNSTGMDIATSMSPTYAYTGDGSAQRDFIMKQVAGGMPLASIGAGIGTMLTSDHKPEWQYNWTAPTLSAFAGWLQGTAGVRRMDFWRADIDHNYAPTATQPFVFQSAAAFLSGSAGGKRFSTAGTSDKLAGVNFVAEGFEGPYPYDAPESFLALQAAKETGIEWIQYSFPWYTSSISSTGPFYRVDGPCPTGAPFKNASSPSTQAVIASMRYAKSIGLKVIVRPMIDPDWRNSSTNPNSLYRGDIGRGFSSDQWSDWFTSYIAYMSYWAAIAQEQGADGFCIGAELTATEGQEELWRSTFSAVRAIYSLGPVYYSSTGSSGPAVSWWDASDYVAWDVYPNLTYRGDPDNVTVDELTAAWSAGTLAQLAAVSSRVGRPGLLAESGICSINMAGIYTQPSYYFCYTWPLDEDTQAKYYSAMLTSVWAEASAAGVFFWKWAWQGGAMDPTFFPLNKTTQTAIASFLSSHRGD